MKYSLVSIKRESQRESEASLYIILQFNYIENGKKLLSVERACDMYCVRERKYNFIKVSRCVLALTFKWLLLLLSESRFFGLENFINFLLSATRDDAQYTLNSIIFGKLI
jgi:hypothetical protein